jgi:hypothetical protein
MNRLNGKIAITTGAGRLGNARLAVGDGCCVEAPGM